MNPEPEAFQVLPDARQPERGITQAVEFLLPFVVVGLLWELLVRVGVVTAASLPPPSMLLSKVWKLAFEQKVLWRHLGQSFYRLAAGYLLAVGGGVAAGALLAMRQTLRHMFSPLLSLLISVPTIAWVPPLLITLGLGNKTVITAIFLGGFFAITYNTIRGIEMVSQDQIHAARLMGVSGIRLFVTVLLPGSLVSIITGLRLGIGYAWRALVGGEMLSALVEWGVGKMIYQARFWNDVTAMFVGLMLIGLSSSLLDRVLLKWLEKQTVEKWGMLARG
ncbi:MAG: ABC transporter permease [Chloroflexota bacterium]